MTIPGIIVFFIQQFESVESKGIEFYQHLGFQKEIIQVVCDVIYTFGVLIWAFVFITMWNNRDELLAFHWGQLDYEASENKLQTFTGIERRSPIDDHLHDYYYPVSLRLLKLFFSGIVSLCILVVVGACVYFLGILKTFIIINGHLMGGPDVSKYLKYLPSTIVS